LYEYRAKLLLRVKGAASAGRMNSLEFKPCR
jgi:hypothetical protein